MPKKVAFDMYKGYMDKMKSENQESDNKAKQGTPLPPAPMGGMPMPGGVPPAGGAGGAPVPGMAPAGAPPVASV
jgi:hypothetical protein